MKILNVDTKCFTPENLEKISAFHHYTFTSVLRLDKYLTLFDPESSENSYFVFPLKTGGFERCPEGIVDLSSCTVEVDWDFIEEIWKGRNYTKPTPKTDEERKEYLFRKEDYEDAVVMPWYRSHDVPQYFYVAEICKNLTPRSQFPGSLLIRSFLCCNVYQIIIVSYNYKDASSRRLMNIIRKSTTLISKVLINHFLMLITPLQD